MVEVERISLLEENRELAALGAEPESVLAAESIDVGIIDFRG
jgi:hypothetical protein